MADILSLLTGVNKEVGNLSDSILSALTDTKSGAVKTQDSFAGSIARIKDVAANTEVVTAVQNAAELQAQTSADGFAIAAETDIDQITGAQARLAREFNAIEAVRADKLAAIRQNASVSLIEDPLGWIQAQLALDPLRAEEAVLGQESAQRSNQMMRMNQMTDQRIQTIQKLKHTTSQAAALAKTRVAVDAVLEQAAQVERQGIAANSKAIMDVAQLNGMQLQAKTAAFDAEAKYQSILQQNAAAARSAELFILQRDKLNADNLADKEKEALLKHDLAAVQRGMVISGVDPRLINSMDNVNIRAMLKGGKILDPKIAEYYRMGVENFAEGSYEGSGKFATDPVTAYNRVAALGVKLTPDAKVGMHFVEQARANVMRDQKRKAEYDAFIAAKDIASANAMISKEAQRLVESDQLRAGDPTSAHYLPDVPSLVSAIPGLQQLPGFRKVLAPLIASGKVSLNDPRNVVAAFRDAALAGTTTFEEAQNAIATIYQRSQEVNIASKQLERFGFSPKITYIRKGIRGDDINYADRLDVARELLYSSAIPFGAGISPFAR